MSVFTAHSDFSLLSIEKRDCVREICCCGKAGHSIVGDTVCSTEQCSFDQQGSRVMVSCCPWYDKKMYFRMKRDLIDKRDFCMNA